MVVDREKETPVEAASLYECHLIHKHDSHKTRRKTLHHLVHLYAWAKDVDVDLDRKLLSGEGLTQPQARSFAAWLRKRWMQDNGLLPYTKRKTLNSTLSGCSVICRWFISQYARPESETRHKRVIDLEILLSAQKRIWKELKVKIRKESIAEDLSDEEIMKIENFLRPENRSGLVGWDIATRDYLIWRIAIEFGLRIGEILALRVEDCPTRSTPYFRVMRIEERDLNYFDPRRDPPRPKTLSRDLGILLDNSRFPNLVNEYVSTNRYVPVIHKGKKKKRFNLSHRFLITARSGNPLSQKTASKVAQKIKEGTGVDFHWHLARHAFFNRAYAAAADIQDREEKKVRMADLIVWGGWESPESLGIYSRRARRERAKTPLKIWQHGGNVWNALN